MENGQTSVQQLNTQCLEKNNILKHGKVGAKSTISLFAFRLEYDMIKETKGELTMNISYMNKRVKTCTVTIKSFNAPIIPFEKPKKQTVGSAGIDLFNNTDKDIEIKPGEYAIISTGFFVEIPEGYVGLLFARGSLGYKYGCTLTNSVGVIDSDYRGEVMARITNISQEPHTIKAGERCVQLAIMPILDTEYVEDDLSDTERGISGFGSTGRN